MYICEAAKNMDKKLFQERVRDILQYRNYTERYIEQMAKDLETGRVDMDETLIVGVDPQLDALIEEEFRLFAQGWRARGAIVKYLKNKLEPKR